MIVEFLQIENKPLIKSAIQVTKRSLHQVLEVIKLQYVAHLEPENQDHKISIELTTKSGVSTAKEGDYLVSDLDGEFYPIEEKIFHHTYKITGTIKQHYE